VKVAIVHHWLVSMRGGEKVVEALCEMYPQADLYTHVVDEAGLSEALRRRPIRTTFVGRLPLARRWYPRYLPLMPLAVEQLDLRGYDLVITSDAGPVKGVIAPPGAVHVCYCHSPMRYAWDQYPTYREDAGPLTRLLMAPVMHYLRAWDVTAAARVDRFACNSAHVAARVRKYYRREAEVIPPPVDTAAHAPAELRQDFYLMLGQLVRYKRPDLAVRAFNRLGRPLVVIGSGPKLGEVRRAAGPTVHVMGPQPDAVVRERLGSCRALVFPGEEDFGLVPVEAMASGAPVLAYRGGGALETVVDGETGLFFDSQTEESLSDAVRRFEASEERFRTETLVARARDFDVAVFKRRMAAAIDRALEEREGKRGRSPY
jgi:glycosyltransferase involved in cell wall biosynthesis